PDFHPPDFRLDAAIHSEDSSAAASKAPQNSGRQIDQNNAARVVQAPKSVMARLRKLTSGKNPMNSKSSAPASAPAQVS
ncbi:MAG: hypothetical protein ACFB16_15385, partial [Phormidesmis sp.]